MNPERLLKTRLLHYIVACAFIICLSSAAPTEGAGADGAPASPAWSSSAANASHKMDASGFWWVNNDAWARSHGPQTIYANSQSSWYVVSDQPNLAGAVETYPDTEYDCGGRDNGPPTKTIAQYQSITSTFSEAFPPAGSWDAAYDLWMNNWGEEVMIWSEWGGAQRYWPSRAVQAVTIDRVRYHFLRNGKEMMFFRDRTVTSGSVNILAALRWLVSQDLLKSTDVPTQLEYGVEICSTDGPETFRLTGLTFSLK